jgi:hypothetical protein
MKEIAKIYLCWCVGLALGAVLAGFTDENYRVEFLIWQEFLKKLQLNEEWIVELLKKILIRHVLFPSMVAISFLLLPIRYIYVISFLTGIFYGWEIALTVLCKGFAPYIIVITTMGIIFINLWGNFIQKAQNVQHKKKTKSRIVFKNISLFCLILIINGVFEFTLTIILNTIFQI